jgi:menaquinone-dependent protoporphyrinogen IX oxidase
LKGTTEKLLAVCALERIHVSTTDRPSVLFAYFTYTNQTKKVLDVMAEVLRGHDCDVTFARIELTDPRYEKRFESFPLKKPYREMFGMIPAELRDKPVKIEIPPAVTEREYDLVVIGAPTWWLSTDVAMRTFMESDTARQLLNGKPFATVICCRRYWKHNFKTLKRKGKDRGGVFADGIHFAYQGGQVHSLLSLLSFLGKGEQREKYLGVKIPPTNIQEYHLDQAREFGSTLVARLAKTGTS